MKRGGRGGTEVPVKTTCDEERRWFYKGRFCGRKENEEE